MTNGKETHMVTLYDVHSYKGGVGTTTTAVALAVALAESGTVLLCDHAGGDTSAILNRQAYTDDTVYVQSERLHVTTAPVGRTVANAPVQYDYVVVDNGRNADVEYNDTWTCKRVCVVRNEYLSLRNTIHKCNFNETLVCHVLPNVPLNVRDVASVLNCKPVTFDVNVSLARTIDAGLFLNRPELWLESAREIISHQPIRTDAIDEAMV